MFYTVKDLAAELLLHPRTVKRWWRKLQCPPDACAASGLHRWSERGRARLLKQLAGWCAVRGYDPHGLGRKFTGKAPREDARQLDLLSWVPKTKKRRNA
ncbi:MAG: hypothetical protein WCS94_08230 [Verrucomicrobiota bacterium]